MQQRCADGPEAVCQLFGREQLLMVLADELRIHLAGRKRRMRHDALQELEVGVQTAHLQPPKEPLGNVSGENHESGQTS